MARTYKEKRKKYKTVVLMRHRNGLHKEGAVGSIVINSVKYRPHFRKSRLTRMRYVRDYVNMGGIRIIARSSKPNRNWFKRKDVASYLIKDFFK